jgi:hypothetical protein
MIVALERQTIGRDRRVNSPSPTGCPDVEHQVREVGQLVTYLVTTTLGSDRPSTTGSDSRSAPNSENATSSHNYR